MDHAHTTTRAYPKVNSQAQPPALWHAVLQAAIDERSRKLDELLSQWRLNCATESCRHELHKTAQYGPNDVKCRGHSLSKCACCQLHICKMCQTTCYQCGAVVCMPRRAYRCSESCDVCCHVVCHACGDVRYLTLEHGGGEVYGCIECLE